MVVRYSLIPARMYHSVQAGLFVDRSRQLTNSLIHQFTNLSLSGRVFFVGFGIPLFFPQWCQVFVGIIFEIVYQLIKIAGG
jgi:hypothetical protein